MDKRLPIALALSLLIVVGWTWLFPPTPRPQPAQPPADVARTETPAAAGTQAAPTAPASEPAPEPPAIGEVIRGEERELTVEVGRRGEPGHYRATFTTRGARLLELRTGTHYDQVGLSEAERADPAHWTRLLVAVEQENGERTGSFVWSTSESSRGLVRQPLEQDLWRAELLRDGEATTGVEFRLAPGTGVEFVKRFRFRPASYVIDLELELHNRELAQPSGALQFVLTPAGCMPPESDDGFYVEPQAVAAGGESELASAARQDEIAADERTGPLRAPVPLTFAGVHNKYFAVLLHGGPEDRATLVGARYRRVYDAEWARAHPDLADEGWRAIVTDVDLMLALPARGERLAWRYEVYAGPKDREVLAQAYAPHVALTSHDLGFFRSIASVLLWVLGAFEKLTGNWGWAIILLTLAVRAVLFPINRRSQTSMARYQTRMKRLQPRIDEVKKKYASDPLRQRQEQAKLMQEEGAMPPLGGCLTALVQIPVFFGLFQALRTSFDLRQAPFHLWINDLSKPDRLLPLNLDLPWILPDIQYLNVLPPLMVVLWILQQRAMPKPADEQAAMMYKMMMWMPIMMGFFLYNYAAGLSLYMITQSVLGIAEQKVIKKYWPVDERELPRKPPGGFMQRVMAAAQEQQKRSQAAQQQRAKGQRTKKARA